MSDPRRIEFLGCPIDSVTEDEAFETLLAWRDAPRESHLLLTVNAAILMMMRDDEELRSACLRGDLITADGMPVVWASRLLGKPLVEKVSGCDLMGRILADGGEHGLRVFFLGAKEEVIAGLVDKVEREHPGIVVAGYRNGYFGPENWPEIVEQIRASNADVLFVGMPTPFKEVWCEQFRDELCTPAIVPVGGSFDVHAGYVRRAPKWMQRTGLEWFWRLAMEPRKMWKRYLTTNTRFLALFAKELVATWLGFRRSDEQNETPDERTRTNEPREESLVA